MDPREEQALDKLFDRYQYLSEGQQTTIQSIVVGLSRPNLPELQDRCFRRLDLREEVLELWKMRAEQLSSMNVLR